jgi:Right handed beta helix region
MSIRSGGRYLLAASSAFLFATQVDAATYYVRNGGNDRADGRSHATAWATIGKVNAFNFQSGDKVLFHEGHVWKGKKLTVDWSGTSSDRAVVGAYYVDDGVGRRGVRGELPRIDGEERFPATRYDALVFVSGDRVRLENLDVRNSDGRGVTFNRSDSSQAVNLTVFNTYDAGIMVIKSNDALVDDNYVLRTDRGWLEGNRLWASAIQLMESPRGTIRNNMVVKVFGEGININHNSADARIEDNIVFGARAVGIYADASPRPTICRNMVLGTAERQYWRNGRTVGAGIALANEAYHYRANGGSLDSTVQTRNGRICNNLVAGTKQGVALWHNFSGVGFQGTRILNNTLVDNDVQFTGYSGPAHDAQFANNILLSLSGDAEDILETRVNGLVARNNYFSHGNPGGGYSHSRNRYQGAALGRMAGWRAITSPSAISDRDFLPSQGSSTNGAGDTTLLGTSSTRAARTVSSVSTSASSASTDLLRIDFNGEPHQTPADMGGLSH